MRDKHEAYMREQAKLARETMKDEIRAVKVLLDSLGITIEVGGCGCCGSPDFRLTYKGEEIASTDSINIDTNREDPIVT